MLKIQCKSNKFFLEKKEKLILLSNKLRKFVKDDVFKTVNEAVLREYSNGENLEFHTFKNWIKKGSKVKKGEKAFMIWGKPPKVKKEKEEKNEEAEFSNYFPVCYVFSNLQVEKIEKKEANK